MQMASPRINKMPSKEFGAPKDVSTENHSVNTKGSDVAVLAEKSGFHHIHNSANMDMCKEPVRFIQGEGHSKQEVLGSAEQVVAPGVQPFITPAPITFFKERTKADLPSSRESGYDETIIIVQSTTAIADHKIEWGDFWNEACKLADMHHPNVVAFYGVVLDGPGGTVATVTEFMINGSLQHALLKNDKSLNRRKRLLIAMDVAFGMEYLHVKNIIHFDLKSDNLLVNLRDSQRSICKVADLGLSKVKCQTLISGGVRGTLPWMSPELLNGGSTLVSDKVDVFSFGIVMWELLTGEEPYPDLHYGAIIGGIVSNTLRPPVPESCDPEWRLLMEQCWSPEPSEGPNLTVIACRLRSMAASYPQK